MDTHSWATMRNAALAVAPVLAAAVLANLATMPNIPTWYAGLEKPSFNPPDWVFGPAWTILYVLMAYAFFRVLQSNAPGRSTAIWLFLLQIILNGFWSWAFFAGHSPLAGLIVIVALLILIVATAIAFWKVDRLAGVLFLPYIAWVGFATVLNWEIFRLN